MSGKTGESINVSASYKFYVLKENNYGSWKWQFLNVMRALKYVPRLLEPSHDDLAGDAEALAILGSTLDERNARTIQNYTTFREAFNAIVKMHENKTADEKQSLFERLNSYRIERVEKVSEGIGEVMEIVAQLRSMKESISDTNIIGVMSASLPEEFNLFKAAWKGTPEDKRTVEEFTSRVFAEASDLMQKRESQETTVALMTKAKNRQFRHDGDICRYCKEPGHHIKNCKKLKRPYDPNYRKNKSRESESNNHDNLAFAVKHYGPQCDQLQWIVDSGCTHHMSPHAHLFANLRKAKDKVTLADTGSTLDVEGFGSISTKQGLLKEVYFVPKLGQNLFSVRAATQNGLTYIGKNEHIVFLKGHREVLRANLQDNMYILQLIPTSRQAAALSATFDVWHSRFAHCSKETIKHMKQKTIVDDLDIVSGMHDQCENCALGKCTNTSHPARSSRKATQPGQILHVDTSGQLSESLGGSRYILLCKDEFSSYRQVAFVKKKSEIADHVKKFIAQAQLDTGNKCLKLMSDQGSEFLNNGLSEFLNERGIIHELSSPHVPEQNGFIERDFRTLNAATRTMLLESKLDISLWAEATSCAVYVLNRTSKSDRTPYEAWHGKRPSVKNFHMFGERAIIKNKNYCKKFEVRGIAATFIGYTSQFNTFKFLCNDKVVTSCDCVFTNKIGLSEAENKGRREKVSEHANGDQQETFSLPRPTYRLSNDSMRSSGETNDEPSSLELEAHEFESLGQSVGANLQEVDSSSSEQTLESEQLQHNVISSTPVRVRPERRLDALGRPMPERDAAGRFVASTSSKSSRKRVNLVALKARIPDNPQNYEQARARDDWPLWQAAMADEMASLVKNQVFIEIPSDQVGAKPIDSRWVLTKKYKTDGSVSKYKARIVAKGYRQMYKVDFNETYCPVVHMVTLRWILAYSMQRPLTIRQFDVKTAFLYGQLNEKIYLIPPDGYKKGNKLWLLKRALYGLRQAPRMWNLTFDAFLRSLDLQVSKFDSCIYYQLSPIIIIIIYVDDGVICAEDAKDADRILKLLEQRSEIRELDLTQYRGLQIMRDHEGMTVHQSSYVHKLLIEFGFADCKPVATPVACVKGKVSRDLSMFNDHELYRKATGSLNYLAEASRPDIMHAVNRACRKNHQPTVDDWIQVKRIFRYLRYQPALGLRYSRGDCKLIAFSDADFAGDEDTKRSTTGFIIMYGDGPIQWKSQRQGHVTTSSTEAEYIALCSTAKEVVWLRKIGLELEMLGESATMLKCDNESAIKISTSERITQRSRHIAAQEAYVRELVASKELIVSHVRAADQLADFLTKPVTAEKFSTACKAVMVSVPLVGASEAHEGMLGCVRQADTHSDAPIDPPTE